MQFIRSLIFNIFLYLGIILVLILAIPTLFLPAKFALYCGKFLAHYIILILRIFLNTKVVFHGLEKLAGALDFDRPSPSWIALANSSFILEG